MHIKFEGKLTKYIRQINNISIRNNERRNGHVLLLTFWKVQGVPFKKPIFGAFAIHKNKKLLEENIANIAYYTLKYLIFYEFYF